MALLQAFGKRPPKGKNQMQVKAEVSESDAELKTATLEGLYQHKCCIMQERKRLRAEVVKVDKRIASVEKNHKLLQDKKRKKRQASSSEEKTKEDILKNHIPKKRKKVTLKKRVESEEESEQAAEYYVEERAEWYAEGEYDSEEWYYAWKWFDQGGDDDGIPKECTPCAYLFKNNYCKRGESCLFSHNIQLFGEEPFVSYLKEQCWVSSSRT